LLKKSCAAANYSLFTLQFSLKNITFASRMQKKDITISVLLAALVIVLLVLCVRSVTKEVQREKKQKEFIEHVRNN